MLTLEFANTFCQVVISLFILSMLKLKFGDSDAGKAIHFITGV